MRQCLFLGLALLPSPLHGVTAPPLACLRCRGGGRDGERPKPRSRDFGHSVHAAASKLCQSSRPLLLAAKKPAAPKPIPLARHMRGIVFGGMDGILTTFALLAAVAGSGGTSPALTLVIGISTVLADGLSMGAGEYLSAKAEAEIATGGDAEETTPLEKGFAMFVAFTLFGAMPLLGFLLTELLASGTAPGYHFQLSVAITGFTLFALGTVKSTFGAGRHRRWMGPDPPACDGALGAPRLAARGARAAPWGSTVRGRACLKECRGLLSSPRAQRERSLSTPSTLAPPGTWWKAGGEVTIVGGAAACVAFYTAKLVDFLVSKSGALS